MICLIPRLYVVVVFLPAWQIKWNTFLMKSFMLGCRLIFKAYEKNVREKATKCSLKTTEVLLDADGGLLT